MDPHSNPAYLQENISRQTLKASSAGTVYRRAISQRRSNDDDVGGMSLEDEEQLLVLDDVEGDVGELSLEDMERLLSLEDAEERAVEELNEALMQTSATEHGRHPYRFGIASINFKGDTGERGNAKLRKLLLSQLYRKTYFSLIFVQECPWANPTGKLKLDSQKICYTGVINEAGILWNSELFDVERLDSYKLIDAKYTNLVQHRGRVCICKVTLKVQPEQHTAYSNIAVEKEPNVSSFIAISWHGPHNCKDPEKGEIFRELLKFVKTLTENNQKACILGGDFNFSIEKSQKIIDSFPGLTIPASYGSEAVDYFIFTSDLINVLHAQQLSLAYDVGSIYTTHDRAQASTEACKFPPNLVIDHSPVLAVLDLGSPNPFSSTSKSNTSSKALEKQEGTPVDKVTVKHSWARKTAGQVQRSVVNVDSANRNASPRTASDIQRSSKVQNQASSRIEMATSDTEPQFTLSLKQFKLLHDMCGVQRELIQTGVPQDTIVQALRDDLQPHEAAANALPQFTVSLNQFKLLNDMCGVQRELIQTGVPQDTIFQGLRAVVQPDEAAANITPPTASAEKQIDLRVAAAPSASSAGGIKEEEVTKQVDELMRKDPKDVSRHIKTFLGLHKNLIKRVDLAQVVGISLSSLLQFLNHGRGLKDETKRRALYSWYIIECQKLKAPNAADSGQLFVTEHEAEKGKADYDMDTSSADGDDIRRSGLKLKRSDVDPSSSAVALKKKKGPERLLMGDGAGQSRVMTETAVTELPQVLKTISTRLTAADVKRLKHVWIARTGAQETAGMETSEDLMRTMVKRGEVSASDLGKLAHDMTAAGMSFAAFAQDIPGVQDELRYPKTVEAVLGPLGGEVGIPEFVKLIVPQGVLEQDTIVTISTVDIPNILRDPEGVSWTSGYPWSLDEAACPRELLDQVLFSPAVDVNLHGGRPSGPVELQTWRPPGSEGMGCVLLKHHDGEGWTDITASTEHHIYPERLSVFLQTFSPVGNAWAPLEALVTVGRMMVDALSSRTLDCRFAAYIKPRAEEVQCHVVCRDKGVETNEYLPGFTPCGSNKAMFDLYHGDIIEVAVECRGGQNDSKQMELRSNHCKEQNGQNVQMLLSRPSAGERVSGEVSVKKIQVPTSRAVCQFIIYEEGDIPPSDDTRTSGLKRMATDVDTPSSLVKKKKEAERQLMDVGAGPSGVVTETVQVVTGLPAMFKDDVNMAGVSRHDLYLRISQNLVDSERRDLHNYVSGTKVLPARDLEHMDPYQIFINLEHKGMLKEGDLSMLEDLMTKIFRDDFADEARQIASEERKARSM